MNITYHNYPETIVDVDWTKIPKNIREVKDDMQEFYELYNDDATIKETFDLFLTNVNKHLPKEVKKPAPAKRSSSKKDDVINEKKVDQAFLLSLKNVMKLMPKHQVKIMRGNHEMYDELVRINKELGNIPTKEQGKTADESTVYAHYFYGQTDHFILDRQGFERLFNFTILNGDSEMAELGYVGVDELVNNGRVELDFYWKPVTLAQAKYKADSDYFENPNKKKPVKEEAPAKKESKKPKNLAEFKKWMKANIGNDLYLLSIIKFFKDVPKEEKRVIKTVQTNSFSTLTPRGTESWLDYGKASNWKFTNEFAKNVSDGANLTYFYEKPADFGTSTAPAKKESKLKTTKLKNATNFVIVNTVNGEGYSEPTVKYSNNYAKAVKEYLEQAKMFEYGGWEKGNAKTNIVEYINGDDAGTVHLLSFDTQFAIIEINPDTNNAFINYKAKTYIEATKELRKMVNVKKGIFESDDVQEWNDDEVDNFGSHSELADGFVYYEIVGEMPKVEAKKPAPAKKKTIKPVIEKEAVNFYNDEFRLLRRFYNLVTKKENPSFRSVQLLYMAFEKTAVARKVRKTSTDATLYNTCNTKLVKIYNAIAPGKNDAKIIIEDKVLLKELEKLVKGKQVDASISLLNRVINMQGTAPDNIKVERLVKAIENAIKNKKVTESNRLYTEIVTAKTELKSYLKGDVKKVPVKKQGLSRPVVKKKVVTKKNVQKAVKKSKSKPLSLVLPKEPTNKVTVMVGEKPAEPKAVYKVETIKGGVSTKAPLLNTPASVILPIEMPEIKEVPKQEPPKTVIKKTPKNIKHNLKPISVKSNAVHQYYNISGDIATLLGAIEIKPVHSVAVTLDAPQGSGKTRAFFQIINEFSKNYKCLFISAEEHPESALFLQKVEQYIDPANQNNVFAVDETNFEKIKLLIPDFDIIFFDSWNKIAEKNKGVDFDNDLRKGFDGKLFPCIFQRTTGGTMRGGAKAQFDGDVILKISKEDDFKYNFIYADKNRYQNKPLNEVCYNIYEQKLVPLSQLGLADESIEDNLKDLIGKKFIV